MDESYIHISHFVKKGYLKKMISTQIVPHQKEGGWDDHGRPIDDLKRNGDGPYPL